MIRDDAGNPISQSPLESLNFDRRGDCRRIAQAAKNGWTMSDGDRLEIARILREKLSDTTSVPNERLIKAQRAALEAIEQSSHGASA